jgi:hypothetical protein
MGETFRGKGEGRKEQRSKIRFFSGGSQKKITMIVIISIEGKNTVMCKVIPLKKRPSRKKGK